jgi:hypothetical protein
MRSNLLVDSRQRVSSGATSNVRDENPIVVPLASHQCREVMPGTRSPTWRYPSRARSRNRRYAADAELAREHVVLDRGSFAEGQQPGHLRPLVLAFTRTFGRRLRPNLGPSQVRYHRSPPAMRVNVRGSHRVCKARPARRSRGGASRAQSSLPRTTHRMT